ncbi:MAG TPA: menaquinone biosynthesis protein [Pirellulaceae bacterium]|jgi:chorismate dehydratase
MRIGAVSYLNTKPLVYRLTELAPEHELIFDLPSRLADNLAAGRLDIALIPSIEFFQRDDYQIVSDACIACRGPVRSVKLFSRVEPAKIHTLALDEGSRTSVALVQILLQERVGVTPKLLPLAIDARPEDVAADAILLIGDRAMQRPSEDFVAEWDLGDIWCRWAELPFVFAMWVARKGSREETTELAAALSKSRDLGVANVVQIAAAEHAAVGLNYDECLTYLRDHLYFHLGPRENAGLKLFQQHVSKLDLSRSDTTSLIAGTKLGPG